MQQLHHQRGHSLTTFSSILFLFLSLLLVPILLQLPPSSLILAARRSPRLSLGLLLATPARLSFARSAAAAASAATTTASGGRPEARSAPDTTASSYSEQLLRARVLGYCDYYGIGCGAIGTPPAPRATPRGCESGGLRAWRPAAIIALNSAKTGRLGIATFETRRGLMTSAMASDQLKKPKMAPPVFNGSAESIVADAKGLIESMRKTMDKVASDTTPENATFDSVLKPLALDDANSELKSHVLGFYQAVSTNQSIRDASTQADQLMTEFAVEASMRDDIFERVDAVYGKKESLDSESQRLLEKTRKDFIRNGLSLPKGEKRDRFKEIKLRLSNAAIEFQKNLNEEKGGLWFTLEELDGVPQDVIDTLKKGEGENAGKVFLTFKYPDYLPTQDKCKVAETRKKTMIANENKCNQNIPLFKETIQLRDEAARLLGYKNHAAFRIEDKMAKTPEFVDSFQDDLKVRLKDGGAKEKDSLLALKEKDLKARGQQSDGNYYMWDHRFYNQLMLEQDYQLDSEKVKEYFPLQVALSRMLEIFEQLMGLRFVEIVGADRDALSPTGKGTDLVWHEDVQMYAVWDAENEGNGFVGYLYTDLHPREGKYGHAANFNIWPGFTDAEGNRRSPATALVCNFSKPTAKKPSLLKHDEIVTLFHELGHGIHDLVGKTIYSRFHGTGVVQDFVEAPSKMLENWCWEPKQIKGLGQHYSSLSPEYEQAWRDSNEADKSSPVPPKIMPDDLVNNIIKTKHVNEALFTLRQLHFGTFDMAVHSPKSHDEVKAMDPTELYNQMRSDIMPMTGPTDMHYGNGQATFGHLMGGYDAGYYGYMIAETYSSDMFASVFKKDPMDPQEGRRYRRTVLEKGGSRDELESLKEFLGRPPNSKAFYEELGLESR